MTCGRRRESAAPFVLISEQAPAKVNLVLEVGPLHQDGLHPLCSLFASVELADLVTVEAAGSHDAVICPGVEAENLAARALAEFRAAVGGAAPPPLRVTIDKRIPVAAGMGGGSADAAAVLRAANALAGAPLDPDGLRRVGANLGSDVPSQVEPGSALVTGVGEEVEPVDLPSLSLVLLPQAQGLSTAAVYAELDRLRAAGAVDGRESLDPGPVRRLASGSLSELAAGMDNDLEAAALSLRPDLERPLADLRDAGALCAHITGSGPTAFGVFSDLESARAASRRLPGSMVTTTR
jgi:4-diphosphocytidyl-2-C-methyl-D-erythritol kinase